MAFQILDKNNKVLSRFELDREAAAFWGVELDKRYYAIPSVRYCISWYDFIGNLDRAFDGDSFGWDEVLKSEDSYWKPFHELFSFWKRKGLTLVKISEAEYQAYLEAEKARAWAAFAAEAEAEYARTMAKLNAR